MDSQSHKLRFFLTTPHSCNYIDGQEATSLFADPLFPKNRALYSMLVAHGFRRSGEHLYKPHCSNCSECVPVRIPVNDFRCRRQQRRNMKKNQDIVVNVLPATFDESHFKLYQNYLSARHPNGGMDNPTTDNYQDFLWADWSDTSLFEFKLDNKLVAVAVVDNLVDGNSAVYTFFDPDYQERGLGKYAILYLIEHTRKQARQWLYLGYWIAACGKMKYKIDYQPIECYLDNEWKRFSALPGNGFAVNK